MRIDKSIVAMAFLLVLCGCGRNVDSSGTPAGEGSPVSETSSVAETSSLEAESSVNGESSATDSEGSTANTAAETETEDEKVSGETETIDEGSNTEAGSKDGAEGSATDRTNQSAGQDEGIKPNQFRGIFEQGYIEEMAEKYAINLLDDGKNFEYEGDIGDVIPEYKDVDLNGDGKPDVINRKGQKYIFEFSDGSSFETGEYSNYRGEGELIEFADITGDNIDEILISHYVFSTAGPIVADSHVYSYFDGNWKQISIIPEDEKLSCAGLEAFIAEKQKSEYPGGYIRFVSVVLTEDSIALLVDYGMKDGADQAFMYEAYSMSIFADGGEPELRMDSKRSEDELKNWPYDTE